MNKTEEEIKNIEALANDIREFLLEHEMWIDTAIFFNGKVYSTNDRFCNKFYYNDREHLQEYEYDDPSRISRWMTGDLCMTFEGPLYDVLNSYCGKDGYKLEDEFMEIFSKHGYYFELGEAWNLSSCKKY